MKVLWSPGAASDTNDTPASWDNKDNWSPQSVPDDVAVFEVSSCTAVTFSETAQNAVKNIEFASNAIGYTFLFGSADQTALTIEGEGISNYSGIQQSFVIAARGTGYKQPQLAFTKNACAGNEHVYYRVGPQSETDYGGGVLRFSDQANAGSAHFSIWTGAGVPPNQGSTVGGEVAFSNNASAAQARFTVYGSLGVDGDTFGNLVFHDSATAESLVVENIGGTVSGGDGGNTQFYGTSTADKGTFYNYGGTHAKANGGDVAFDTQANGGTGIFHNYAAPAKGAYGGVTSFNNNWPDVSEAVASSAGNGRYINYGARNGQAGGGGHTSFSARYGSPTAGNAVIENHGSSIDSKSSAGHTYFSVTLPSSYFPTAANATIHNYPAVGKDGAAGYTAFSVYEDSGDTAGSSDPVKTGPVPTAGKATIINYGGATYEESGGSTSFSNNASAGEATLIAYGGVHGGYGGSIAFYDDADGDGCSISLNGNAELSLSYHNGPLSVKNLYLSQGVIAVLIGQSTTGVTIQGKLELHSNTTSFYFRNDDADKPDSNTVFTLLSAENMSDFTADQFTGNDLNGLVPTFTITGTELQVRFSSPT